MNGAVEVVGMALMGRSVGHGEHIGDLVVTFKVVSVSVCVCVCVCVCLISVCICIM